MEWRRADPFMVARELVSVWSKPEYLAVLARDEMRSVLP